MNTLRNIKLGDVLTCAETGKRFAAAQDGCTFNYARRADGSVVSDEGVNLVELRELLDRSRPFCAYLSADAGHVTGWKGNVLGRVTYSSESRTGWNRSTLTHVRVIDAHGQPWHGKGAGPNMCITLRPSKGGG